MNMTILAWTKDCKEWDAELDTTITPEYFDGIVRELGLIDYEPCQIEERRKRCYCRNIATPKTSTPELKVKQYEQRYGEKCPVKADAIESYKQAFPDDDMKWWGEIRKVREQNRLNPDEFGFGHGGFHY